MSILLGIKALKNEFIFQSFKMGVAYPLFAVCWEIRYSKYHPSSQSLHRCDGFPGIMITCSQPGRIPHTSSPRFFPSSALGTHEFVLPPERALQGHLLFAPVKKCASAWFCPNFLLSSLTPTCSSLKDSQGRAWGTILSLKGFKLMTSAFVSLTLSHHLNLLLKTKLGTHLVRWRPWGAWSDRDGRWKHLCWAWVQTQLSCLPGAGGHLLRGLKAA